MDVNIIDIIMIVVLVAGAINGYRKGVISQLGGVAAVVIGVWLAFKFGSQVSSWLGVEMSDLVAYIVVFVAAMAASWVAVRILSSLVSSVGLGFVNRLMGAAVSLIFSSLMLSLAIGFFEKCNNLLDIVDPGVLEGSELTGYVTNISDVVFPYLVEAKDAVVDGVGGNHQKPQAPAEDLVPAPAVATDNLVPTPAVAPADNTNE